MNESTAPQNEAPPADDKSLVDTNAASEGETPPANDEAPPSEAPAAAADAQQPVIEHTAPDNFPDKFVEDGKPAFQKLTDAYNQLEGQFKQLDKEPAPEQYVVNLPEGANEDIITKDDPLLASIHAIGQKRGISQDAMDELTGEYVNFFTAEISKGQEMETEMLGENADEIINRVQTFYDSKLSDDAHNTFRALTTTADGVKLFDEIRSMSVKGVKIPSDSDLPPVSSSLTEPEVRDLMKTDAYRDTDHPDFRTTQAKVADGWKALYPDQLYWLTSFEAQFAHSAREANRRKQAIGFIFNLTGVLL